MSAPPGPFWIRLANTLQGAGVLFVLAVVYAIVFGVPIMIIAMILF